MYGPKLVSSWKQWQRKAAWARFLRICIQLKLNKTVEFHRCQLWEKIALPTDLISYIAQQLANDCHPRELKLSVKAQVMCVFICIYFFSSRSYRMKTPTQFFKVKSKNKAWHKVGIDTSSATLEIAKSHSRVDMETRRRRRLKFSNRFSSLCVDETRARLSVRVFFLKLKAGFFYWLKTDYQRYYYTHSIIRVSVPYKKKSFSDSWIWFC